MLGLGLGVTSLPVLGGAAPPWARGAIGFDVQNSRGYYRSTVYSAFDDWWAAVGGVYTRTGTKRYIGSDRLLQTAGANVWPDEFDPQTGARIGKSLWNSPTIDSKWGRDLTNAVWTATNATVAKDQTGLDGSANAASSVTATANGATVLQAISDATSRTRGMAAYIKRLSGTGTIEITADGTTWVDVTEWVTTDYYGRVSTFMTSITNPSFGFRLGTSGDSIAVDYTQLSRTAQAGPPILVEAAAETFAGDSAYIPVANLAGWNPTEGAIMVRAVRAQNRSAGGGENGWIFAISDGTTTNILLDNLGSPGQWSAVVGGVSQISLTYGAGTSPAFDWDHQRESLRWAGRWKQDDYIASIEGVLSSKDTSASLATVTRIYLGARANGGDRFGGWLQEFWLRSNAPDDVALSKFGASLAPIVSYGDSLSTGVAATVRRLMYTREAGRRVAQNAPRTTHRLGVGGSKIADAITQYTNATTFRDWTHIFWTGHNDAGAATANDVIPGFQTLIAQMPHDRWAFMTVLQVNGDDTTRYDQKKAWNDWLRANVPNNTIDVMAYLLTKGDGSSGDNSAIAADRVPPSLLADSIHLNNAGSRHAGILLASFLDGKGW